MSDRTINFTPEIYAYLLQHSVQEPEVLGELRQETRKMSMAHMQISPDQGQFMALLIKLIGAKKSLDIGTFTGYSALWAAWAMGEEGHVIACDINVEWTRMALKYWEKAGMSRKISLKLAPALQTLNELIDQDQSNTFDFAFIDADKANYLNYYQFAFELVKPGGLIAIDNVLWGGEIADFTVKDANTLAIRTLNDYIVQDERVFISLLPVGDGLTLAMKK